MDPVQKITFAHGIFKYIHILLFVYWLGGDAGVFYSSTFVVNPKLSREQRMTACKIFLELDMLPRYCLALMLTVGGILAEYVGYIHEPALYYALWVLGPVWVWVVYTIHHKSGTEFATRLARIDYYFRVFMIVAILASVVYHWNTGALKPFPWLAAKLAIFAFLIFCGFMIRKKTPPFVEGYKILATTGPTPESDRLMTASLAASRPYVLAIWAGVAISALIGVLKPGA